MTLGNRIKQLRQANNLSQPEFAEKAGIEQSYLSKLENDKSLPSNDIFRGLLAAFGITVGEFLADLDWSAEKSRLVQIADLDQWFQAQSNVQLEKQRRYLYRCSGLIVLAVTLFYIGFSKQLFNEHYTQYISRGVIFPDESKHIFYNWDDLIDRSVEGASRKARAKAVEMEKRFDEIIVTHDDDNGAHYVAEVEGGRRYFKKYKSIQKPRRVNAWLQVLGVFLFGAGVMGFVIERRLFSSRH